jgi:trehalose 6-phosphate phosphatase
MNNAQRLDQFWLRLSAAKQAVLLLDYDGTLAPFRVARNEAKPYAGVRHILNAIREETATRIIIISGRAIVDLVPLLGLEPPPEIWGCHGWERLGADGQRMLVDLPEQAESGLGDAVRWVDNQGLASYCEFKPASLALHWRGLSEHIVEELRSRAITGWQPIAARSGLELHPFDGGLELRCPDRSKATAVLNILADLPPGLPIAFLGDDLTDEDGFAALAGRGLGVLVREQPRQTHAQLHLKPPQELIDFLDKWRAYAPRKALATERGLS